jgi:hypothetical protein
MKTVYSGVNFGNNLAIQIMNSIRKKSNLLYLSFLELFLPNPLFADWFWSKSGQIAFSYIKLLYLLLIVIIYQSIYFPKKINIKTKNAFLLSGLINISSTLSSLLFLTPIISDWELHNSSSIFNQKPIFLIFFFIFGLIIDIIVAKISLRYASIVKIIPILVQSKIFIFAIVTIYLYLFNGWFLL